MDLSKWLIQLFDLISFCIFGSLNGSGFLFFNGSLILPGLI